MHDVLSPSLLIGRKNFWNGGMVEKAKQMGFLQRVFLWIIAGNAQQSLYAVRFAGNKAEFLFTVVVFADQLSKINRSNKGGRISASVLASSSRVLYSFLKSAVSLTA